jgi:hypothetical protein
MTTANSIVSLDQGKGIYKDWTLEVVDDTPVPVRPSVFTKLAALFVKLSGTMASLTHGHIPSAKAR